ncbi:PREDICTED: coiled-coil domain-containing protein 171-like isoform X3 [Sturnus vulgaris]|uniref:coiled-coil domain-containing protein 171-like isoform X3 n=1 Tax=Sturnus vulgaris TaxID=9172 RepID=UPI00071A643D|nr:PREDICTED: coiled-coil domain-containing protein 171-like isoform X3 [Sturnus vulgaris]
MNSPSAANISSGEANRSGSDIQGPLLPQDRNPSEMDTIEDLRKKLQKLEEKNLELTNQHNHDMSRYEKEIMKLRLELQRGEALLRVLESEMSFARKDAHVQMYSAEDELCDAKAKLMELQARGRGPRHQRFRYASESQLDQSQSQDFRQALPESDLSIEAMCNRTNSASGADLPSESFWLSFVPEVTTSPRGPAPDESLCVHFEPEAAVSAPLPAPASPRDEYFQPQFGLRGAAAPHPPETDDIFQPPVSPAAAAPAPDGKSDFKQIWSFGRGFRSSISLHTAQLL